MTLAEARFYGFDLTTEKTQEALRGPRCEAEMKKHYDVMGNLLCMSSYDAEAFVLQEKREGKMPTEAPIVDLSFDGASA